jgi:signal transduction histidine kinase
MSQFFNQILTLLTTPPGNLIYHLVLVFSIAGALQGAVYLLNSSQFPQARRMVLGLEILLALQILLFIASSLSWQGLLIPQMVLPPLDRAVTVLSLVWITWLWAFPEPVRLADYGTLLINLLGLAFLGLTMAFWKQTPGVGFNTSIYETIWQSTSLAVVLLGILILVKRRSNGWGFGLAMLLLAFCGHLLTLIWPADGGFPGFVRLTQLGLFPILLMIVHRFPPTESVFSPGVKTDVTVDGQIKERRRYSTDPKTLQALMSMAAEDHSDKLGVAMMRGIAHAMLADLCFLLLLGNDKSLSIACGYDLIREENLEGTALDKEAIPLVANAILRGRPLRLPASSTSSDLKELGKMLGLTNPGHLLSVPISTKERGTLGAILILSPYSNRLWSAEDQTYLSNVSTLFVPILGRGEKAFLLEGERDQARQELLATRAQVAEEKTKFEQTASELENTRSKNLELQAKDENMNVLLVTQEESQKTIASLKKQLDQMRQVDEAGSQPGADEQLEQELHQTLEEMARMQNALAGANVKILQLEQRPAAPLSNEQVEIIASISQELRQPMSSITGYTDLLLGESVGILGSLQRKFIERIKASTERLGSLVDDLIQITNLETGKLEFKAESIDLNLIIDNAMAYTSTQIREKNITLRLDIPDTAPPIRTDRDALQQIFIHLLQNATSATQVEGIITLRVQMQSESDKNFISIQVTDTGGGISADDITRVFERRYRAEHSLIPGLGDTGVGLSIAKALVETQGGRIWVETEAGSGSTFSILLPVLIATEEVN